jgi:hypothetical protein
MTKEKTMAQFFKDLWENFKQDKLLSVIGWAAGIAIWAVTYGTEWVQTHLGQKWYGAVIGALLLLLGSWLNRFKTPEGASPKAP